MNTTKKDKTNITVDTNPDFEGYISTRIKETKGLVEATSTEINEVNKLSI